MFLLLCCSASIEYFNFSLPFFIYRCNIFYSNILSIVNYLVERGGLSKCNILPEDTSKYASYMVVQMCKWPLKNLKESNVKDRRFMLTLDFALCYRNITLENYEGKRLTPANLFVFIKLE